MPSGYTDATVTSGTTITSTWGNLIRDSVTSVFASTAARDSAITSPAAGMLCVISGSTDLLQVYNGSAWVTITPVSALVATSENRTSNTYGALSTAGPAVTVETGTNALVIVGASITALGAGADTGYMSFAVSGATTLASNDTRACSASPGSSGFPFSASKVVYYTSLTAGSNTFTAQYRSSVSTTGNAFADRTITVVGVP